MKRLVVDIDGTLTVPGHRDGYAAVAARPAVLAALKRYRAEGFAIVLYSGRGMRTYQCSVGHLNAHVLPVLIEWLDRHDVPYDEIHVGKPWCGDHGFYVDDRAIRPSEFVKLDYQDICDLLEREAAFTSGTAAPPEPVHENVGLEEAADAPTPAASEREWQTERS